MLIRPGDQAADGAEAEAGADPPAAQGDDDSDGDVGQQRGREGCEQGRQPGRRGDVLEIGVGEIGDLLEDEDRDSGL